MREFNTRTTEGNYSITFNTDDRKVYEQVQSLCRLLVDGKDVEAIPICFIKTFSEIFLDRRERFVLETLIGTWERKRETKVPYINQMLDDYTK